MTEREMEIKRLDDLLNQLEDALATARAVKANLTEFLHPLVQEITEARVYGVKMIAPPKLP